MPLFGKFLSDLRHSRVSEAEGCEFHGVLLLETEIESLVTLRQHIFVELTPSFSFSIKTLFIATNLLSFLARALKTSLNDEINLIFYHSNRLSENLPECSLANLCYFFIFHRFITVWEVIYNI